MPKRAQKTVDKNDASPIDSGETALLAASFEASPDAIYLFSGGRLAMLNNAAVELHLGAESQIAGKSCCEMFWANGSSESCVVDRAIETAERLEVEIPDGPDCNKPVLLIVQPVQLKSGEASRTAIIIARDISDLRRAEADAIAQRSFMASIADRSPDEIYAVDKDGRITWMNERGETDNSMQSGRYLLEFIAEECRDLATEKLRSTLAGEDTDCELKATKVDGSLRDVEAHTSPLWKDAEVTGVLVFLRDVTERKRAQELVAQSDKLRAVGELAAGVAHNLNNSLTVIHGRSQLLLARATDDTVIKSLEVINSAVDDGSKTLRRILEFARRDLSKEFGPVELGELISSSMEIARPKWQTRRTKNAINVQVECNGKVYVMGELAELREVVLNLVFNAVDAMPEGGTMEVGARAEVDSGCFWVADTGVGMSAETSARIFEPFFTTKGKRGTGLGLSASHGIISRHKGEIFMVSEPGEGTRFEVRLPICEKMARFAVNPEQVEESRTSRNKVEIPKELLEIVRN